MMTPLLHLHLLPCSSSSSSACTATVLQPLHCRSSAATTVLQLLFCIHCIASVALQPQWLHRNCHTASMHQISVALHLSRCICCIASVALQLRQCNVRVSGWPHMTWHSLEELPTSAEPGSIQHCLLTLSRVASYTASCKGSEKSGSCWRSCNAADAVHWRRGCSCNAVGVQDCLRLSGYRRNAEIQ